MIGKVKAIVREAPSAYRVSLETMHGEAIGTFIFQVSEGAVEVVTWPADFGSYMGRSPRPIPGLFDSILAFHHAQSLELPPWDE
jgi:hypothetical protein